MDASLAFYNLISTAAAAALPPLWLGSRLAGRWPELWPRLGLMGELAPAGAGPRVWLQAVSVGEVAVAGSIADELFALCPDVELTVTTTTSTGLARARDLFAGRARVAPFPLDLPWPVWAAVRKIKPQVYASLETEIWPNLLARLESFGAGLLMLNGRISPRSLPGYLRLRPLIAPALARFHRLSMISGADADRARAILDGRPADITIDGNAKYAGLAERAQGESTSRAEARLNLGGRPLLAAGSVRTGEEEQVLEAAARVLEKRPNALLALAPRHPEKAGRWLSACAQKGLSARAWSGLTRSSPCPQDVNIVVVDAMGVLFGLYGLAKAAFVGASLTPLGGQNPMEPAAWGKPVAYGPSMEDFEDARQWLEQAGAGRLVKNGGELARFWLEALEDAPQAIDAGRAALAVAGRQSGAASRAAGLIMEQLDRKGAL